VNFKSPLRLSLAVLILSCVVPGSANAQSIDVVTATYGGNCGAPAGNATAGLGTACNGKVTCDYKINHAVIGDPKPGCAKSYAAQWRCPDMRGATIAEEADGKVISLSCQGRPSTITEGVFPPDRITAEIEERAAKREGKPLPRHVHFIIMHPEAAEFAALGRYSVMLLTIHSQKSEELPLRRMYIHADGRDTPMHKVSSWRSDVDSKLVAQKVFGPYRETGFYLLPTGMLVQPGEVYVEFALDGVVVNVFRLPSASAPAIEKRLPNLKDPPKPRPDLKALQSIIKRKFPGFPVPTSLP
jgi:hypothetical protein